MVANSIGASPQQVQSEEEGRGAGDEGRGESIERELLGLVYTLCKELRSQGRRITSLEAKVNCLTKLASQAQLTAEDFFGMESQVTP